jgi:NADH:ubiquinone oxidoreductase subunit K
MSFLNLLSIFYVNNYYFVKINIVFLIGISFFLIGIFGIILKINQLIIFLICIELMWLGISICFLGNYIFFLTNISLIFALVILTIAASETAIGLSLLVNFYRINKSISLKYLTNLRG